MLITWLRVALGDYSSRLVSDWSPPDGYDPVLLFLALSRIIPMFGLMVVLSLIRLLALPPLVLISLLIMLPLSGMSVAGDRLILFDLLVIPRLVGVSALSLGFFSICSKS